MVFNGIYDTHSLGIPRMTGCRPFVPSLARAEAHAFVLTEDHCKRFVDIFDIDRNGVPGQMSLPHVSGKGTMSDFGNSFSGSAWQWQFEGVFGPGRNLLLKVMIFHDIIFLCASNILRSTLKGQTIDCDSSRITKGWSDSSSLLEISWILVESQVIAKEEFVNFVWAPSRSCCTTN